MSTITTPSNSPVVRARKCVDVSRTPKSFIGRLTVLVPFSHEGLETVLVPGGTKYSCVDKKGRSVRSLYTFRMSGDRLVRVGGVCDGDGDDGDDGDYRYHDESFTKGRKGRGE